MKSSIKVHVFGGDPRVREVYLVVLSSLSKAYFVEQSKREQEE